MGEKEMFYPGCKPDPEGSTEGRTVIVCDAKIEKDGMIFKGQRPMKIIIERGRQAIIEDDGGSPDILIERVLKHIEKNRL